MLAQPPPNFLSFFMPTIINESNNNCFTFFNMWLSKFLSSSGSCFSLCLSCLQYFYFLSWRDDVLQWCHIHNLHSATYVRNHTNTILQLARPYVFTVSENAFIFSAYLLFPIYSFLFFFGDSSCFSSWSVVICRQETGRFRQEDHHLNSWRSSSILKSPKLCFNNSILHHSVY